MYASCSDADAVMEGMQNLPKFRSVAALRQARAYRRLAWTILFNGDLGNQDALEHYEVGCCPRNDTREKMRTLGAQWLTAAFQPWRRNDWLGHEAACEVVGGLAHTHNLLLHGFSLVRKNLKKASSDATGGGRGARQQERCHGTRIV